jgi:hypothetical protein
MIGIRVIDINFLKNMPWRRSLVVLSPPATEEIRAMGRDIPGYM